MSKLNYSAGLIIEYPSHWLHDGGPDVDAWLRSEMRQFAGRSTFSEESMVKEAREFWFPSPDHRNAAAEYIRYFPDFKAYGDNPDLYDEEW